MWPDGRTRVCPPRHEGHAMKFRIRVKDADGQESAVTLTADDRESALAEAKRRGLRPLSIQPVPAKGRETEEDEDDEEDDEPADDGVPRKCYRVVCSVDASAVLTQTALWMVLLLFTCGMAAPFFGYFYFKLILNHIRIEEVAPARKSVPRGVAAGASKPKPARRWR